MDMPNEKLKLCLIVEMLIDPNDVGEETIRDQILSVVSQAVDGGIITGTSDAELLDHKAYVSRFTKNYQDIPEEDKENAA